MGKRRVGNKKQGVTVLFCFAGVCLTAVLAFFGSVLALRNAVTVAYGEHPAPEASGMAYSNVYGAADTVVHAVTGAGTDAAGVLIKDATEAEKWSLLLVNPWHSLPEDFSIKLAVLPDGKSVDARISKDLTDMLDAAREAGFSPVVASAYRSAERQAVLYDNQVAQYRAQGYSVKEASVEAAKWVAPPGASEHQTGLAVDIVALDYQTLDEKQADTPEQQWLMENAWQYGFILRYPADKTDVTGIAWEPWHYRYVGKSAAREIRELGLCLEEYLDQ